MEDPYAYCSPGVVLHYKDILQTCQTRVLKKRSRLSSSDFAGSVKQARRLKSVQILKGWRKDGCSVYQYGDFLSRALHRAQCLPHYVRRAFRKPSCHLKTYMSKQHDIGSHWAHALQLSARVTTLFFRWALHAKMRNWRIARTIFPMHCHWTRTDAPSGSSPILFLVKIVGISLRQKCLRATLEASAVWMPTSLARGRDASKSISSCTRCFKIIAECLRFGETVMKITFPYWHCHSDISLYHFTEYRWATL